MTTVEKLRKIGIFNQHGLLQRFSAPTQDVGISWRPREARACKPAGAYVYSPSHHTDPNTHWMHYGCKTFTGNAKEAIAEAIAWASERYGITDWAVDPTDRSARVPAIVRKRALAAIK